MKPNPKIPTLENLPAQEWRPKTRGPVDSLAVLVEGKECRAIPLNHHKFALVDTGDLPLVSHIRWHCRPYNANGHTYDKWSVRAAKPRVLMSRVITGASIGVVVDHKNGNPLDNRRENLRVCSSKMNAANQVKQKRVTSSRFKGVTRRGKRWEAHLKFNQKYIYLGSFSDEGDAALAYNKAAVERWGEFANLNPL